MFYTYILYSESIDKFYIGHTSNLEERIARHNRGGEKFTSKGQPWKLSYSEKFETKILANSRERQIKKWKSRVMIEKLIDNSAE